MEIKLKLSKKDVELLRTMVSVHRSYQNVFKDVCDKIKEQLKEVK